MPRPKKALKPKAPKLTGLPEDIPAPEPETPAKPAAPPREGDIAPSTDAPGEVVRSAEAPAPGRDATAPLIKISKLQSMSMPELTRMAKEMGIENFGTMKKQELIYHILQENSKRAGTL